MRVSTKVTASALAAAVSTIFWTVAAATFAKGVFDDTVLALLTGSTTTVLTFLVGFIVPESDAFLRQQQAARSGSKPPR